MGVLSIRQRSQNTQATLPGVRQVDHSAIGNNAIVQHQARGGIGLDIQNAVRNISDGLYSSIEAMNARDEREAIKMAEQVRSALEKEKVKYLNELSTKPELARDWNTTWEAKVKAAEIEAKVQEAGTDSYLAQCYQRNIQAFKDNAYVELFKTSTAIARKDNQETKASQHALSMMDVLDAPIETNEQAVLKANEDFTAYATAMGWDEATTTLKRTKFQQEMASGLAAHQINEATTKEELDEIRKTLDDKNGSFGSVSIKDLTREQKNMIKDSIRRKEETLNRDALAKQAEEVRKQYDVVEALTVSFNDNNETYYTLSDKLDKAKRENWDAGAQLKAQQLVDNAKVKEMGYCLDYIGNIEKETPTETLNEWDKCVEQLSPDFTSDPRFKDRYQTMRAAGVKLEREFQDQAFKCSLDMLIYDYTKPSDKESRLKTAEMWRVQGKLSREQYQDTVNKINKMHASKVKEYANRYADSLNNVFGEVSLITNADGTTTVDTDGTYSKLCTRLGVKAGKMDTEEHERIKAMTGELRSAWQRFSDIVDMSPTWKDEEIENWFRQCFAPASIMIHETKMGKATEEERRSIEAAQRSYNALWIANKSDSGADFTIGESGIPQRMMNPNEQATSHEGATPEGGKANTTDDLGNISGAEMVGESTTPKKDAKPKPPKFPALMSL